MTPTQVSDTPLSAMQTDLPARHAANCGPDPDGWSYYVTAHGIGKEWVVESIRRRTIYGGSIQTQRMLLHECGGAFEAGRIFERDIQTWRDYLIERKRGTWE